VARLPVARPPSIRPPVARPPSIHLPVAHPSSIRRPRAHRPRAHRQIRSPRTHRQKTRKPRTRQQRTRRPRTCQQRARPVCRRLPGFASEHPAVRPKHACGNNACTPLLGNSCTSRAGVYGRSGTCEAYACVSQPAVYPPARAVSSRWPRINTTGGFAGRVARQQRQDDAQSPPIILSNRWWWLHRTLCAARPPDVPRTDWSGAAGASQVRPGSANHPGGGQVGVNSQHIFRHWARWQVTSCPSSLAHGAPSAMRHSWVRSNSPSLTPLMNSPIRRW